MKKLMMLGAIAAAATLASAGIHDVDPGVIFGSGNSNGNFTVNTTSNVQVGLRAKVPFAGTTHYDGGSTYTYAAGTTWNFDWSINTDVDGNSGLNLGDFTYELSMFKINSSDTADALTFDLIKGEDPHHNRFWYDHSFGDNDTTAADDTEGNSSNYAGLVANNNVAQNSWKYGFFNDAGTALEGYDINAVGTYLVRLSVLSNDGLGTTITTTDITVNIVPLPTAAFAGLGLLGVLGGARVIRRR